MCSQSLHEPVGLEEGPTGLGCAAADRLANQEAVRRITSGAGRPGWADFVFAFHDGEEIGPRMLARIARRTGLRPEDL